MGDPTLYGPAHSTMVSSARLAMLALDLPHDFVEPDLHRLDGARMTDLLPYFVSQPPTLLHDGLSLHDTEAILLYIDAIGSEMKGMALQPPTPRLKALMWQIMSLIRDHLHPATIGGVVAQRVFVPHLGGRPDVEKLTAAVVKQQDCLTLLEQLSYLCHDGDHADFLIDDQPRLADLLLMPILHHLMQTDLGPACLARSVRLSRWWLAVQKLEKLREGLPRLA
ncbi:MAG: glutathione S-transferase family protein [Rhodospirillaceae bacterium]|nr:MAG: glutathione S-transferase family protein [Rhodospirillaceae bacterium]